VTTVTFSLPDGDAEFEVEHYQSAGPYRWNEPPEPGEIVLKSPGTWTHIDSEQAATLPIEGLVRMYMFHYGIDEATAVRRIEDEAFEDVTDQWEASYDERDPE
jgi:hypothetical protein